jgi:NADPH2:quinone reductase
LAGATVIGTTSTEEKKKLALEAGADHIILYKSEDIKSRVMQLTDNQGVDVVFDGVGKTTFDTSLSCLKKLGSMVSFGNASGKVDDIDIMKLVPNCIRLTRPSLFQLIKSKQDFEPRTILLM